MSDLVTMKIAVDAAEVTRAAAEMKILGRTFTDNEREMLKSARAISRVNRDLSLLGKTYGDVASDIQKMSRETSDWLRNQRRILDLKEGSARIAKEQAAEEARVAKELERQLAAEQKLKSTRSNTSVQNRIESSVGFGSSAMAGGAGFDAMAAQIDRLADKFQPLRAASRLYEQELTDIKLAHANGVIGATQYEAAIENLTLQFQQFQNQQAGMDNIFAQQAAGIGQAANRMNNFGVVAQQTGYQVSDFFVQVQSGTNPMVAFSQQTTQLAGLLYLLPPSVMAAQRSILGFTVSMSALIAGFTIAIPILAMLAMNFIDFGNKSDEASKKVDRQKQAIDALVESTRTLRLERQMEQSGATSTDEQVTLNEQNDILRERLRLLDAIANARSQEQIVASQGRSALAADNLEAQREALRIQLETNQAKIDEYNYERDLNIAERRRANDRRNQYREQIKSQQEANKLLAKMLIDMVDASRVNLAKAFNDAKGPLNSLVDKVSSLYEKMVALAYIERNQVGGQDYIANQYRLYGEGQMAGRQAQIEAGSLYTPFPVPDDKTGGGGGKTKDSIEGLRSQYDSLMGTFDPLIAAQNTYNQQLATLDAALKQGAISGEEYRKALALIKNQLEETKDPLNNFKKGLEDALDPEKNYIKGLEALQSSLADFLFNPFEVGLDGMVLGFSRALQRMASEALAAGFMKMLVGGAFGATGSAGSSILSFLANANGNAFSNGNVIPFANGGVVGSPTLFPMRNGTGLMGEAGPEAIMPLKRGADGKLGVSSGGGSANNIKIVNVMDGAVVGNYLNTPEGEEVIMNVMRRTGVV